jgi:hypothetical protein
MRRPRLCVVSLCIVFAPAVFAVPATAGIPEVPEEGKVFAQPSEFSGAQQAQQPQQPVPPTTPAPSQAGGQTAPGQPESSSKGTKSKHAHDFLIRGTVFQSSGLAFPGITLRIRRESEKKFRWQTVTNSRGEFAVRVPQGIQYEVTAEMKGYAEQSRKIDASSGISEENVTFRLETAAGGKKK